MCEICGCPGLGCEKDYRMRLRSAGTFLMVIIFLKLIVVMITKFCGYTKTIDLYSTLCEIFGLKINLNKDVIKLI